MISAGRICKDGLAYQDWVHALKRKFLKLSTKIRDNRIQILMSNTNYQEK